MDKLMDNDIINYIDESIIILDNHYNVVKINKAAETIFQLTKETSIGKNIFQHLKIKRLTFPFDEKDLKNIPIDCYKFYDFNQELDAEENNNIVWKLIKREFNKEKFIYIIGNIENYTLKKSYKYIKDILEQLPEYIYWKDANLIYQGCNTHVAKYLNLKDTTEIIGKHDTDFGWSKERVAELLKIDTEILNKGITSTVEDIIPDPYGRKRIMVTSKSPLFDDNGNIIGILGISLDITDRKKMEQDLIDAIASKSTFLSIASHEIKGPLTNTMYILKMVNEAVEQESLNKLKDLKSLIELQIKDSGRGIETINYLLDFLNLDLTGPSLREPKKIALGLKLFEIIDPYEEKYKNITFSVEYDQDIPKMVILPKGLDVIINILVANAVKYSKKNAYITVKLNNLVKNGKTYLQISVEDNGAGISKAALDRFFAPLLFEGMKDGERVYSAPAIKLSYAKKFIESLGGELTISSELDVGTTVTIIVPYEKSDSEYKSFISDDESYTSEKIIPPHQSLNFLVVEDNPVTLHLLESEIIHLGHHVDAVPNAHEALKKAKERDYEVAFLDISLPGIDGVELKQKLTKPGEDLPIVIAITSHDSKRDKDYFLDKGFVTVIGKPFTKDDIIECIDTIQRVLIDINSDGNERN